MEERADLPGLESATLDNGPGVVAFLLLFAVLLCLLFPIAWLLLSGQHTSPVDALELVAMFGVGLLLLWCLANPFFDYRWKTDPEGLTVSRFWKRRRIEWREVTAAETRWINLLLGRRFVISAGQQRVLVPTGNPHLSASVWQHLNRLGLASGIVLDAEAQALWRQPVPAAQDEVAWENPHPVSVLPVAMAACVELLVFSLVASRIQNHFVFWLLSILAGEVLAIILARLAIVNRFVATPSGFEAVTRLRTLRGSWAIVKSAAWAGSGISLKTSWFSRIYVPWRSDDEQSQLVISAIIEHLRDRRPQLLVPVPRTTPRV